MPTTIPTSLPVPALETLRTMAEQAPAGGRYFKALAHADLLSAAGAIAYQRSMGWTLTTHGERLAEDHAAAVERSHARRRPIPNPGALPRLVHRFTDAVHILGSWERGERPDVPAAALVALRDALERAGDGFAVVLAAVEAAEAVDHAHDTTLAAAEAAGVDLEKLGPTHYLAEVRGGRCSLYVQPASVGLYLGSRSFGHWKSLAPALRMLKRKGGRGPVPAPPASETRARAA